MSTNRYRPHLIVLVEDDADRQITNGFILHPNLHARAIQVMRPLGGWKKVVETFKNEYVDAMRSFPERRVALIIDGDSDKTRFSQIAREIPSDLSDRVFVLGVLSRPEDLRGKLNLSFEKIGEALARECYDGTRVLWRHELLRVNEKELERMVAHVRPFLFQ